MLLPAGQHRQHLGARHSAMQGDNKMVRGAAAVQSAIVMKSVFPNRHIEKIAAAVQFQIPDILDDLRIELRRIGVAPPSFASKCDAVQETLQRLPYAGRQIAKRVPKQGALIRLNPRTYG